MVKQAKQNPSFNYEHHWQAEAEKTLLTDEELTTKLLADLKTASLKVHLDSQIYYDLQQMIINRKDRHRKDPSYRPYRYRQETISFVKGLLEGVIPKIWTDGLVKLMQKEVSEMTWKEN